MDLWRFDANTGDYISVRIGSPGLRPWLRLYGPTGVLFREGLASVSADTDTLVSGRATNSGTFLVVAQSYYDSLSSPYTLHLAKVPGTFTVSPGDEGGPLTSGLATQGTNSLGDLDMWTFTANTGDYIALRVGAPGYRPWIQLHGPSGLLMQESFGGTSAHHDAPIFVVATNSGLFTLVQQSYYLDGVGPYTVNFARIPGPSSVSPGDEGGQLTNGVSYDATLALGDIDLWQFSACKNRSFTLMLQELSGGSFFTPRLRLFGQNGTLLATAQNATTITLNYPGTNSGNYYLLVDGAALNDGGTYRLTAVGIYDPTLTLCPPVKLGSNLELSGYGGNANSNYVLLTSPDLLAPVVSWSRVQTNQFDSIGTFVLTNSLNPAELKRFFRIQQEP